MTIGSGIIDLSPGFTAFARPGVVGMPLKKCDREVHRKDCSCHGGQKAALVCKLWAVKIGRMGGGSPVSGLPNAERIAGG